MVDFRKVLGTFVEYIDEINLYIGSDVSRPIIDAIKKQIPQKPVGGAERPEEVGKIGYDFCPTCGEMVTRKYCPNCGTRILWEDEQ